MNPLALFRKSKRPPVEVIRRDYTEQVAALEEVFQRSCDSIFASFVPKTSSGIPVTPRTAMQLGTVYAAVRNLSEDVSKLPIALFRTDADRNKTPAVGHPLFDLIGKMANAQMGSRQFRETLTSRCVLVGNGYAEIVRNSAGLPVEMFPITGITPVIDETTGRIFYEQKLQNGQKIEFGYLDIFQCRGFSMDGMVGMSVVAQAKDPIGHAIAVERFGGAFFGNGAIPGVVIKHPGKNISSEAAENIVKGYNKVHRGAGSNHRTTFLDEGMEIETIGIPPDDAQFIQTQEWGVENIARWFRMPPSKLGHVARAQGWSTLEMSNTEYVTDTLTPWFMRWVEEIMIKLVNPLGESNLTVEFNTNALLRGDTNTRGTFYQTLWNVGAIKPDEIRAFENLPALEDGGDETFVPLNSQTLTDAVSETPDDEAQRSALIQTIASTHTDMLAEVLASLLHTEKDKLDRAAKRGDAGFAKSFYAAHAPVIAERIKPIIRSFVALAQIDADIDAACDAIVERHAATSKLHGIFDHYERRAKNDAEQAFATIIDTLKARAPDA